MFSLGKRLRGLTLGHRKSSKKSSICRLERKTKSVPYGVGQNEVEFDDKITYMAAFALLKPKGNYIPRESLLNPPNYPLATL